MFNNYNPIVVKSNALVESSYYLPLEEQKFVLLAISQIRRGEDEFDELLIRTADISRMFNKTYTNAHGHIKQTVSRLLLRSFELQNPQNGDIQKYHWFSVAHCNRGMVILKFSDELKPFLLNLEKEFTKYDLRQIVAMSSVFGLRLYEYCKQYKKIGLRHFALSEEFNPNRWLVLPDALGCKGKYSRYSNFKQKVLMPALKQVREKSTEFKSIEFEEVKVGNKVCALRFTWGRPKSKARRSCAHRTMSNILMNS